MFVQQCETRVNAFLTELQSVAKTMVETVAAVQDHMEGLRRDMTDDERVDVKADIQGTQNWSNNIEKGLELIRLAQKNMKAVTTTIERIRQLTTSVVEVDVQPASMYSPTRTAPVSSVSAMASGS